MSRNVTFCLAFLLIASSGALAEAPNLQTPSPVIYLADNLDEADQLGWCIDTQGRGFGAFLHAHSCKPQGGDVQFGLEVDTGLIRSVAFPEYCMLYDPAQTSPLGLVTCDVGQSGQRFEHRESGEITRVQDASLCLTVGDESASAGPFMSRGLDMQPCDEVPDALKTWMVLP